MIIITLICILLNNLSCFKVEPNTPEVKFNKKNFNLDVSNDKKQFETWVAMNIVEDVNDSIAKRYESLKNDTALLGKCRYEDNDFEVYSSCNGEFGGNLYFVDKQKEKKIYYIECTCLKMIDYKDNAYLITQTLAHMSGLSEINKIKNPRALPTITRDSLLFRMRPRLYNYENYCLLHTGGTWNVVYPYQNKYFVIYNKMGKTYLGEINKHELIMKDTLLNFDTWSYGSETNKIKNGIYISSLHHESNIKNNGITTIETVTGAIYIKKDTIIIGYKYGKHFKED